MVDDQDEMIERVAETLRPLPHVDASAKARLLIAVAAERERDREAAARGARRRSAMRRMVRGAGLAAAAAVAALWLRAVWTVPPATMTASGSPSAASTSAAEGTPGRLAAADADAAATARRPVELVLRAPSARNVRVVGDFNGWDGGRSSLVRDPASGLWSVTLALTPGRHVYAFIVDDTLWMRDPRMPAAPDADFGRPGSVLLVGQP